MGIAHERQIERESSLVKGGYQLGFFSTELVECNNIYY
jgi:hypothetical protein